MTDIQEPYITILVTSICNLDCTYCYAADRAPDQTIDLGFARRGIDDYFQSLASNTRRKVRLFGTGEPTTRMDVVRGVADYVAERWSPLELSIQTNGYFNPDVAQWLADNCGEIILSCDGSPAFQDRQRPLRNGRPTSPVVSRNLAFLASRVQNFMVRATITNLSVDHQTEIIDYLLNLGVRHILVDHLFGSTTEHCGIMKPDYLHYARRFVEAYEYAQRRGVVYWCSFMSNMGKQVEYHCKACAPSPHLLPNGLVSTCDLIHSLDQLGADQLIYGSYDASSDVIHYDLTRIRRLRARTIVNLPSECRQCEALHQCAGGCPGEAVLETGNMNELRPHACEAIRFIVAYFRDRDLSSN